MLSPLGLITLSLIALEYRIIANFVRPYSSTGPNALPPSVISSSEPKWQPRWRSLLSCEPGANRCISDDSKTTRTPPLGADLAVLASKG